MYTKIWRLFYRNPQPWYTFAVLTITKNTCTSHTCRRIIWTPAYYFRCYGIISFSELKRKIYNFRFSQFYIECESIIFIALRVSVCSVCPGVVNTHGVPTTPRHLGRLCSFFQEIFSNITVFDDLSFIRRHRYRNDSTTTSTAAWMPPSGQSTHT